jgi:hypothetical protein
MAHDIRKTAKIISVLMPHKKRNIPQEVLLNACFEALLCVENVFFEHEEQIIIRSI